jgi:DNA-binding transcriptional ArsR family regulator
MVEDQLAMSAVFHALSHDVRRDMLHRLRGRELTVGELAEPLTMSLAAASKHVQVLERAGLIERTVDGRRHICRLEAGPLAAADAWLRFYQRYWTERLDALEAHLAPTSGTQITEGNTQDNTQEKD